MYAFVFDTETTGLPVCPGNPDEKQPRIIEIAYMLFNCDSRMKSFEFSSLCNPGIPIPKKITEITGISNDMVKDKPPFSRHIGQISEHLEKCDIIVAHNLSFDIGMLELEYTRAKKTLCIPEYKFCTVEQTEHYKGFRLNLNALYEHLFSVSSLYTQHRAMSDVYALSEIFSELVGRGEVI